uniref:Spc7 kinetochore protein domain-containing protein n=1 Tax=Spongospora subterranea TaxID=70186 RepID=A0A0H5R6X2_9EUKA|eukprot:CRZ09581.1 hypothetical protein [Spongospora subterranea]
MEVDKENWLPMAPGKQLLSRRRSTGIMKGGDSTGSLLSPKPNKKQRSHRDKTMRKRNVSFGGSQVRVFEKDVDWSENPTEARSFDLEPVPLYDQTSPNPMMATAENNHEDAVSTSPEEQSVREPLATPEMQTMLRALIDDDDDECDDQTMDMTVNHGIITIVREDEDADECPKQAANSLAHLINDSDDEDTNIVQKIGCKSGNTVTDATMELTTNYSSIYREVFDNDLTMDMTTNHSRIVAKEPVFITVMTDPPTNPDDQPPDHVSESLESELARTVVPDPEPVIFAIVEDDSVENPKAPAISNVELEVAHEDVNDVSDRVAAEAEFEKTGDITRHFQAEVQHILSGSTMMDERTIDLPRFAAQMTEDEAMVALEFKRILSAENDITISDIPDRELQLDNVEEFLSSLKSPPKTRPEVPEACQINEGPVTAVSVPKSVQEFISATGVRFMDSCNWSSNRKTLSFGFCPNAGPLNDIEKLKIACIDFTHMQQTKQSVEQLTAASYKQAQDVESIESWINGQAPRIWENLFQIDSHNLSFAMTRLKGSCKLQSKIKWNEYRIKQEERLRILLAERVRLLTSDKRKLDYQDSLARQVVEVRTALYEKLQILRSAIDEQAGVIDVFNSDLDLLSKRRSTVLKKLEAMKANVDQQQTMVDVGKARSEAITQFAEKSRELAFLGACVDWTLNKCSGNCIELKFGSTFTLSMQVSGQGKLAYVLSSKLTESNASPLESALFKFHSEEFDNLLMSCGSVADMPPVLNELSLKLGRIRSLAMELKRLSSQHVIFHEVQQSGKVHLMITVSSIATTSSVTFTVDLGSGWYPSCPLSLVSVRILSAPGLTEESVGDLVRNSKGWGSLTKICTAVLASF